MTETGDTTWLYMNPIGSFGPVIQGELNLAGSCFRVERYAPDYTAFEGRDLSPGLPIELEPLDLMCDTAMLTSINLWEDSGLQFFPNPTSDMLYLENLELSDLEIKIVDGLGRKLIDQNSSDAQISIKTDKWPTGIYTAIIRNIASDQFFICLLYTSPSPRD